MAETTSSTPDTDRDTTHDPLSLPLAVRAVLQQAGHDVDLDDLCAVMGLPFLFTAVPDEPNLSRWLMYARDAFLIPAGRLFGLTIRELHPPDAARGLDRAEEFRQHFDASYRPLILRALEHNQPVLAWRGWPPPFDLHWGLVTETCAEGVAFRGPVFESRDGHRDLVLQTPATQCYVVESIEPLPPQREAIFKMALWHAHVICRTDLSNSLNVLAGTRAFEEWHRRAQSDDWTTEESQKRFEQCVRLAHDVRTMFASVPRILEELSQTFGPDERQLMNFAATCCHKIITDLELLMDAWEVSRLVRIEHARKTIVLEIARWIKETGSNIQLIGCLSEFAQWNKR